MAIIGSMNKGIFYFFVSHNNNLSSFHFPLSSFFLFLIFNFFLKKIEMAVAIPLVIWPFLHSQICFFFFLKKFIIIYKNKNRK
jgi:hypothetical protein